MLNGTTDMTSEREPLKPIPAEDPAIQEALAALDSRISVFASVIAHAVAELGAADQAGQRPETATPVEEPQTSLPEMEETSPAEVTDDRADETGEPVPGPSPRIAEEEAKSTCQPDDVEAVQPVEEPEPQAHSVEPEPEVPAHEALSAPDDEVARDVLGRAIPPKPAAVEPEEPPPVDTQPSEQEEDEALLASLDEETAKAIRVMRRLSPVEKRVSELLEEYRETQATPKPASQSKKKSWWTRG